MQQLWDFSFGTVVLIFWVFGPGIIQFARLLVDYHKEWYVTRWRSYYLGEMIIWPIFLGLTAVLVDGSTAEGFYTELWFLMSVASIAWLISIANAWLTNKSGKRDSNIDKLESERLHTIYFGVVVAAIVSSACALWYAYDNDLLQASIIVFYVTVVLGAFGVLVFAGDVAGYKIKKDPQTLDNR